MAKQNPTIQHISHQMELLMEKHKRFAYELNHLQEQLNFLKQKEQSITQSPAIAQSEETVYKPPVSRSEPTPTVRKERKAPRFQLKTSLEKFIGENLINKIGIIITIIGVAIGAKYSIDNDLIQPLTRIILGYVFGASLMVIGFRLRNKYQNYSAVLVSGGLGIFYFINFFAYDFYELIPQPLAFALMVLFTIFAVIASLWYNLQVISIIGLIGAYSVPFLLSNNSANYVFLYSYMLIINAGILFLSFKKEWKIIYYLSFGVSWIIFLSWYAFSFYLEERGIDTMLFSLAFFLMFYVIFLAYKLTGKKPLSKGDMIMILLNTFIYFGINYDLLQNHESWESYLGLFTLGNAIIHFVAAQIIWKKQLADKQLFYFVAGLVLVFVTMAIPVQLDGNWVTLLWVLEAGLLFWLGRTKQIGLYEKLGYVMMLLAFISRADDWSYAQGFLAEYTPIFNIYFLSGLIFSGAFVFIFYNWQNEKTVSVLDPKKFWLSVGNFMVPVLTFIVVYATFLTEITAFFNHQYYARAVEVPQEDMNWTASVYNENLMLFKSVWIMIYSMLFVAAFVYFGSKKWKTTSFRTIAYVLVSFTLFTFLATSLWNLGLLRENYIAPVNEYFDSSAFNLIIRYIAFLAMAIMLFVAYKLASTDKEMQSKSNRHVGYFIIYGTLLWVLSAELFHWLDLFQVPNIYKLAASIFWGVYALMLVALGIWKNRKVLRIFGISLFGITLLKLFFYDISHLNTLKKTVVFITLGVLMLLVSYLYNRFKEKIVIDEEV